jgi:hypothetical protein
MKLAAIAAMLLAAQPVAAQDAVGDDPVVAVVLERELHRSEIDALPQIIYDTLVRKYVAENDLAPTAEEIDDFLRTTRAACEQARSKYLAERERLQKELASPDLDSDEAKRLTTALGANNFFLREPCEREDRELASWVVYNWKVNSSLFHRYGGRVFWEQVGYDPKDARVRFLEEHRENGAFEIYDTSVAQRFWKYFTFFASGQLVSEETGIQEMATPWWLRSTAGSP